MLFRIKFRFVSAALLLAGFGYPLIVYWGAKRLPASLLIGVALALLAIRGLLVRKSAFGALALPPLLAGIGIMLAIALLRPALAPYAYPVIMSLAAATAFAVSLARPPSLAERMARLAEPSLPAEATPYLRRVTMVWAVFLFANAGVAATLCALGATRLWVLWTGCLSYVAMGCLFAAEFAVRIVVRRRVEAA